MKYFAKYLPTDQEPKENDMCLHPEYGLGVFRGRSPMGYICWEAAWTLYGYRFTKGKKSEIRFNEKCDSMKKAELFLCSEELAVGDTVWTEQLQRYDTIINESQLKQIKFLEGVTVVGKISSDAKWVKHGDIMYKGDFETDTVKGKEIIFVKCPTCKAVH